MESMSTFHAPDEEAPLISATAASYHSFSFRSLALRLEESAETRKLGSAPPEPNSSDFCFLDLLWNTAPKTILLLQVIWSLIVTVASFSLVYTNAMSSSKKFWTSHLAVSPSVSYGVGWALFTLLGFFIREASNRYWQAQLNWSHMSAHLRYVIRDLRQAFPTGSWHSGDIERIAAHLVALPIALKMHLRGEREHQQLEGILCPEDIRDLLKAQIMPFHCTRIVRTYFSAAQDDAPISFASTAMQKSPAGLSTRH
eukprot:gb/GEZJ01008476.1/.p1 GENE.gb/GEZJ01008476.1/~~gb/GEZJ01008476.1/.p1  ORF type:complete len:286 (-),score=35.59 gb/GEZJ01008476.1/:560-1324(-)